MQSERGPVDGDIGGGGLKTKLASRLKKRSEDSPEKRVRFRKYCLHAIDSIIKRS